jgi:serine/threonine protein kinase
LAFPPSSCLDSVQVRAAVGGDRFEVLRLHSWSACSLVYEGRERTGEGRGVALKVLLSLSSRVSGESLALLQYESRCLQLVIECRHCQQSLALYSVPKAIEGRSMGVLASLWAAGPTLRQLQNILQDKGIRFSRSLLYEIAIQLLEALVVVTLIDFGVAKLPPSALTEEEPDVFSPFDGPGTAFYMSPEALQGRAHVDHRSDLYSVGVLLQEMLGMTSLQECEGIGPFTTPFLRKSLHPDPRHRFATANDMKTALQDLQEAQHR